MLYISLGFTAIANLNDHSVLLMPECIWSAFDNLELWLRYSALTSERHSEFGEKLNACAED